MIDNTSKFRALTKIIGKNDSQLNQNGGILQNSAAGILKSSPSGGSSKYFSFCCSHARQILADITELRNLVLDKRKEYILCSNAFSIYGAQRFMSDDDRKKFDKETDMAIAQCTKLIKDLEVQIDSDQQLRKQDERKHLITVVNLLNVYLKEVIAIVVQLREIHIRKIRQIRKFCRLANLIDIYGPKLENMQKEEEEKEEKLAKMKLELEEKQELPKEEEKEEKLAKMKFELEEEQELPKIYEPINKAEQTQLMAENRKIFDKFTATDAELQRIGSHVAEIQRLQNMFAEKISEQEQDIDVIHSRTVYTLDNLEQANNYIREAIKNQANRRVIMIFCLLVLTFTLLFLDWYNP